MAVEDFASFHAYVAAIDRLVATKDRLLEAIEANLPEPELRAARGAVTLAQSDLEATAFELDHEFPANA